MESLLHRLGVTHLYSIPYHPHSNEQIERFNSTMNTKIATLSDTRRADWDIQLPHVIFNYNAAVHSVTKIVPFTMMYGRPPVFHFDAQDPIVSLPQEPHYIHSLKTYLSDLTKTAQDNTTNAQRQYKSRYDSHRSNPTYKVGDVVLIRSRFPRHKFYISHEGPFASFNI